MSGGEKERQRENENGKRGTKTERQTDRETERLTEKRAYVVYAVAFWMPGQNAFGPLPFDGIRHGSAVRGAESASHRHELEPPCRMPHGATHRETEADRATWHLHTATHGLAPWPAETVATLAATKGLKSAHKKSVASEMYCCCCCCCCWSDRQAA